MTGRKYKTVRLGALRGPVARPLCFLPLCPCPLGLTVPSLPVCADCRPAEPRVLCSTSSGVRQPGLDTGVHCGSCHSLRPSSLRPRGSEAAHGRVVSTRGPTASEDGVFSPYIHSALLPAQPSESRRNWVSELQLGPSCVNFVRLRSC